VQRDIIQRGLADFENKFGRIYDIRIYNEANILPGRGIYAANHFHHLDPAFILFAIARHRRVLTRQLAKPSLFKVPFIRGALRRYKAIMTPRPSRGEDFEFDDFDRMRDEITAALEVDEPVSFAYAAHMTESFGVDAESCAAEKKSVHSGLLTLVRKIRGLKIVPVAVDTYEPRTWRVFFKAFLILSGIARLLPRHKRCAVDIMFGEPVDIDEYLQSVDPETGRRNSRHQLVEQMAEKICSMRQALHHINQDDPDRSLQKYTRKSRE
jgi:1-acyl-sn-glycerol-3-phosphate acyltransferase